MADRRRYHKVGHMAGSRVTTTVGKAMARHTVEATVRQTWEVGTHRGHLACPPLVRVLLHMAWQRRVLVQQVHRGAGKAIHFTADHRQAQEVRCQGHHLLHTWLVPQVLTVHREHHQRRDRQ